MCKIHLKVILIALMFSSLVACKDKKIYIEEAKEIIGTCVTPKVPYGAPIVKVKFTISENGVIKNKYISHTSGYKNIDDLVLEYIETCEYSPEISNGIPQASWMERTYTWSSNLINQ